MATANDFATKQILVPSSPGEAHTTETAAAETRTTAAHTDVPRSRPSKEEDDNGASTGQRRSEWQALLQRLPPEPPEGAFRGRGVVMHGGGLQHTVSMLIVVRVMRSKHVGCTLPIEYWYRGDAPPTPAIAVAMRRLGVTPRDVDAAFTSGYLAAGADIGGGGGSNGGGIPTLVSWAAKPVAILLSSFEEIVAIDSDVIPLVGRCHSSPSQR